MTHAEIEAYIKSEFLKDESLFKTEWNKFVAWVEHKSVPVAPVVTPKTVITPASTVASTK